MLHEQVRWRMAWRIDKYRNAAERLAGRPYEVAVWRDNLLLNEGINLMLGLVCGGAGTVFSNANSYLAVGDSSNTESASQTGLQAPTNKHYEAMDVGYPTYGTEQKVTWRATFESADANFDWNEFSVANGNSDAAINLNRKVQSEGTKIAGQEWVLTATLTIS